MTSDDQIHEIVEQHVRPPLELYSGWVAELMTLIRDEGTQRQKTRAAEIGLTYMSRLQEYT
jgi:hypothetical protein